MERLTIKNKDGVIYFVDHDHPKKPWREPCETDSHQNRLILDKLAEYEDAEEKGLLVKLPCRIGETLYDIFEFVENYDSPDIYVIDASRIEISKDEEGLLYSIDGVDCREKEFGTTLFTSEEAALKAIREQGWII